MCEVITAVSAGVAVAGAAYKAYSAHKQGEAAKASADRNAVIAEQAASDAQQRGAIEAAQQLGKGTRVAARQKAAMIASGADVTDSGVRDVINGTMQQAQMDANTIRNNAAREAWGLQNNADASRMEGAYAKQRAGQEVVGSILGGTGSAIAGGAKIYALRRAAKNGLD